MVLDNGTPVAFDDDSGVARMSWLHLNSTCPAQPGNSCEILVASRGNDKFGLDSSDPNWDVPVGQYRVTLAWDEDVHNGRDADGDGLGDALEDFLFAGKTNVDYKHNVDTDGDGIHDAAEVIGGADAPKNEETKVSLLRFPFYGADPLQKDLFIEADWERGCVLGESGCIPALRNQHQLDADYADGFAAKMAKVAVVHLDTGNAPSANGTTSGNWGGAEILDNWDRKDFCKGSSPARKDLFFHVIGTDWAQNSGKCSVVRKDVGADVHETGHYFGLDHWGKTEAGKANCKPHHVSVMNYAHQEEQTLGGPGMVLGPYSAGTYADLILNPSILDEYTGIGSKYATSPLAGYLGTIFGRTVSSSGSVDWNMDDVIAPQHSVVRGVLNYAGSSDCDRAPYATRETARFATARQPTVAVTDVGLVMLGPVDGVPLDGRMDVRMFLGMPNLINCENAGFDSCASFGDYPLSGDWPYSAYVNLNPAPGLRPPAAAGGIVVYADAQGSLWYFRLSVHSETGGEAFGVSGVKAVGGPPVTGAPIAVKDDASGRILVFAPAKRLLSNEYSLKRWEYDPVLDIWWVSGSDEYWSTGDKVVLTSVDLGLGITTGRLSSDPAGQMSIFAAIPAPDTASGKPIIEIARLLRTQFTSMWGTTIFADSWSRLDPGIWTEFNLSGSNRVTDVPGRLSLAFLPEGTEGRFYLAFRNSIEFITFTRGNVPWDGSGSRPAHALDFVVPAPFYHEWAKPPNGISLVTFTGKIRAAAVITEGDWASFFPNADGIYNSEQKDFDEVTYVASHMACALKHNCSN